MAVLWFLIDELTKFTRWAEDPARSCKIHTQLTPHAETYKTQLAPFFERDFGLYLNFDQPTTLKLQSWEDQLLEGQRITAQAIQLITSQGTPSQIKTLLEHLYHLRKGMLEYVRGACVETGKGSFTYVADLPPQEIEVIFEGVMPLREKARKFACAAHAETNHKYGEGPYSVHLAMVAKEAEEFAHLLPAELREMAIATAWTHDTIEDARLTFNDVKKELGGDVAEYTYLLTNLRGRNRKERAGKAYYEGLTSRMVSAFVKICDRLANAQHSVKTGSRMTGVYREELPSFKAAFEGVVPLDAPSVDDYNDMVSTMFAKLEGVLKG